MLTAIIKKDTMSITENLREKNRKKRKIYLILFVIGILLLIGTSIFINQIGPWISNLFAKPKYMEIQIPGSSQREFINKQDSVLSVYLLSNDSVVLQYTTESRITKLSNIDSFLSKRNFKILLIEPSPNIEYNSLVTILGKIKEANIKQYAIVGFNKNELDSILRTKK
jgi:biopolymer transport protein ExbD